MKKKELIEENKRLRADIKNLVIYNEDTIPTYIHWVTAIRMEEDAERLTWVNSAVISQNFDGFEALINKQGSSKNKQVSPKNKQE